MVCANFIVTYIIYIITAQKLGLEKKILLNLSLQKSDRTQKMYDLCLQSLLNCSLYVIVKCVQNPNSH